jgi:hypothetical protein
MPSTVQVERQQAYSLHPRPVWKSFAVAFLPVGACFLGGATAKWAEGIVVAFLGVWLLIDPPRHSLGKWFNLVFLGLLACAALAFLPRNWFFQPAWRTVSTNDFGIQLPGTLSPQPWVTLECLVSLLAGLSWFYYVCAQEFEMRDVRFQVRLFAAGVVLLAFLSILFYAKQTHLPFWHNQRNFGPFPNRNQTGNLFGLTAIILLASGQDHFRRGKSMWVASALGFFVLVAALILNYSRAGILILIGGCALWLALMAVRQKSVARIAIGLSLLLLLLTALLVFGGATLERFHLRGGEGDLVSGDFRWLIFQDTWHMISTSPWCGIGLGNFEPIFAVSRIASVADTRSLHPESDWLWLWSELGWPGVALVLIGIALIVPHVFPLREGTNQRIRLAAFIAAIIFALHGLIDVSGHRVGTALTGVFLFGSALHRPFDCRYSRVLPMVFRTIGVVLLVVGVTWTALRRLELPVPGSLGADNFLRHATIMYRSRGFDETVAMTTRALSWAPLNWKLYFLRAQARVDAKENHTKAVSDFQRARFLEPNGYEVPFHEGLFWLSRHEPILALTAWREALQRAGTRKSAVYGEMFFRSPANVEFLRELTAAGANDPDLILVGLDRVARERFDIVCAKMRELNPDLLNFTPKQRERLFGLWAERGNFDEFVHAVEAHPDWKSAAWEGMAKYYAKKQDYRSAVVTTLQYAPRPAMPVPNESISLESLQQQFRADVNNFSVGCELYQKQMREHQVEDALATVRHFTASPGVPAYFHFLEAEAWAIKGNWERAWNSWLTFDRSSKR